MQWEDYLWYLFWSQPHRCAIDEMCVFKVVHWHPYLSSSSKPVASGCFSRYFSGSTPVISICLEVQLWIEVSRWSAKTKLWNDMKSWPRRDVVKWLHPGPVRMTQKRTPCYLLIKNFWWSPYVPYFREGSYKQNLHSSVGEIQDIYFPSWRRCKGKKETDYIQRTKLRWKSDKKFKETLNHRNCEVCFLWTTTRFHVWMEILREKNGDFLPSTLEIPSNQKSESH